MESSPESKVIHRAPYIARQELLRDGAASFVVSVALELPPVPAQVTT
jgi:hypothetical protein